MHSATRIQRFSKTVSQFLFVFLVSASSLCFGLPCFNLANKQTEIDTPSDPSDPTDSSASVWGPVTLDDLTHVPFLEKFKIPTLLNHPFEKRGFVEVPLDYSRPKGPKIEIFYRMLPMKGRTLAESDGPLLVVINGGPGFSSVHMRPLFYDYSAKEELPLETAGRLEGLSQHFRILLVDQRGTNSDKEPGFSAPINTDDPTLNPSVIQKHFDAEAIANDYRLVLGAVLKRGERFAMLAQSFGGMVAVKYLQLKNKPMPSGLIFASSAMPFSDSDHWMHSRRQAQKDLLDLLAQKHPKIPAKIRALKKHFVHIGMDPNFTNYLWEYLGKNEGWEAKMDLEIDTLLKADRKQTEQFLHEHTNRPNLLNYILSAAAFHHGITDRNTAKALRERIPFEDWMPDETWCNSDFSSTPHLLPLLDRIDKHTVPPLQYGSVESVRKALGTVPVLFTFGDQDALVEPKTAAAHAATLTGRTENAVLLHGGHAAAFFLDGPKTIWDWLKEKFDR